MKKAFIVSFVVNTLIPCLAWAGRDRDVPEIPSGAAPLVIAGIAVVIFAVRGSMKKRSGNSPEDPQ